MARVPQTYKNDDGSIVAVPRLHIGHYKGRPTYRVEGWRVTRYDREGAVESRRDYPTLHACRMLTIDPLRPVGPTPVR